MSGMSGSEAKLRRVFAHVRVHGLGAAIEARERGADRPVVLCDQGGQRIASASAVARRRGVRPGMSLWEAQRRCPEVVVAAADPEKYEYFRRQVVEICGDYTPRVWEVAKNGPAAEKGWAARLVRDDSEACDIALDLTGTERLLGPAKGVCQEIRNRLKVEVGVAAAIGIGPNPLVACLACESARPGEVEEVEADRAAAFVGELPIFALPGVDAEWTERLGEMGIRRAKDLAALPAAAVERALGEWGRTLWEIARGNDPQELGARSGAPGLSWERGAFSVQVDLRPPAEERERVRAALRAVTEEAARKLRQRGQAAGQVKVTLVFRDMRKTAARRTLSRPTQSGEVMFHAAQALAERVKLGGRPVRRVRVSVARLAVGPNGGQLGLPLLEEEARRERLAEKVDQVKDRFGEGAVTRASVMGLAAKQPNVQPGPAAVRERHREALRAWKW